MKNLRAQGCNNKNFIEEICQIIPQTPSPSAIEKARTEFLSKQAEKMALRETKNQERDAAIAKSIQTKKDKASLSKKLDKRTKKGQPFMNVRMKNMLSKIEKDVDKYKMQ